MLETLDPAGRTDIASYLAEAPYSISPVIAACAGLLGDMLTGEERDELRTVLRSTIGTNTTTAADMGRLWMFADFALCWWLGEILEQLGEHDRSGDLGLLHPIRTAIDLAAAAAVLAAVEPRDEWARNAFRAWNDTYQLALGHCHDDYCGALTAAWSAFLGVLVATRGMERRVASDLCHDALIAMHPFEFIESMCALQG